MSRFSQLEQLYDAYASGVCHYFMTFVPCEADAKDLLQDLFIKIAKQNLPSQIDNEKAFVWRLAHNLAVDWLRRKGARDRAHEASSHAAPAQFEPVTNPDASRFAQHVQAALSELPLEQRTVAQMKLWDGLTFDQIATAQGIPLNTAASRYRYAIEKLRTLLRPLYEEIQP